MINNDYIIVSINGTSTFHKFWNDSGWTNVLDESGQYSSEDDAQKVLKQIHQDEKRFILAVCKKDTYLYYRDLTAKKMQFAFDPDTFRSVGEYIAILVCDDIPNQKFWNGNDWTVDISESIIRYSYVDITKTIWFEIPKEKITHRITSCILLNYIQLMFETQRK